MIANLNLMPCFNFHSDATDDPMMHHISGLPLEQQLNTTWLYNLLNTVVDCIQYNMV